MNIHTNINQYKQKFKNINIFQRRKTQINSNLLIFFYINCKINLNDKQKLFIVSIEPFKRKIIELNLKSIPSSKCYAFYLFAYGDC